jgi:hypothetical protein
MQDFFFSVSTGNIEKCFAKTTMRIIPYKFVKKKSIKKVPQTRKRVCTDLPNIILAVLKV